LREGNPKFKRRGELIQQSNEMNEPTNRLTKEQIWTKYSKFQFRRKNQKEEGVKKID